MLWMKNFKKILAFKNRLRHPAVIHHIWAT